MCSFFTGLFIQGIYTLLLAKEKYNGTESDDKYDPVEIVKWKIDGKMAKDLKLIYKCPCPGA